MPQQAVRGIHAASCAGRWRRRQGRKPPRPPPQGEIVDNRGGPSGGGATDSAGSRPAARGSALAPGSPRSAARAASSSSSSCSARKMMRAPAAEYRVLRWSRCPWVQGQRDGSPAGRKLCIIVEYNDNAQFRPAGSHRGRRKTPPQTGTGLKHPVLHHQHQLQADHQPGRLNSVPASLGSPLTWSSQRMAFARAFLPPPSPPDDQVGVRHPHPAHGPALAAVPARPALRHDPLLPAHLMAGPARTCYKMNSV